MQSQPIQVGEGDLTFEWHEDFAEIPDPEEAASGWAHPGMIGSPEGTIFTFHPGLPKILALSPDGALLGSSAVGLTEGHGMTIGHDGKQLCLWVADPGNKRDPAQSYEGPLTGPPRTLKTDLSGNVLAEMGTPAIPDYADGGYAPTQVAVFDEARGGNGDVWITDGYGQSKIHRYTRGGDYVLTINGEEGETGAFKTPHAIHIDTRGPEPELFIADRANDRLQVYDLEGAYKRGFGGDFLHHPAAFAPLGDYLAVGELHARVTILDGDDQPAAFLGDNFSVIKEPGWPNMLDAEGKIVRTDRLRPGLFNGPHGIASDPNGNLYVAEWLIGGRYIKLERV